MTKPRYFKVNDVIRHASNYNRLPADSRLKESHGQLLLDMKLN